MPVQQEGRMESGATFIAKHEKMVEGLACRLRRELSLQGELDDLIAFGYGGLLEARRRFDASRGVRFQTFAYHRVRGAMLDGVRKMAYLPRRAHERVRGQDDVEPTAAPAPVPLDRVFARLSAELTTAGPLQGRYAERSPEEAFLAQEGVACLLRALGALPERQRAIVRGYYFDGRTLDSIARDLGVSKSWASRMHTDALRRLRGCLEH